jgi:DNA adenine methylase
MSRRPDRAEIDFETGRCVQTTTQKVALFAEKMRTIRNPYTGNKRKLLVNLFSIIEKQGWEYSSFLDLFSGSGMVAATARHLGKSVTANDLSPYAYQNARFFLQAEKELDQDSIDIITNPDKFEGVEFVRKYYADRFTPEEATFLDEIRKRIDVYMPGGRCGGQSIESTIALLSVLHYVMDHCFVGGRLNSGQVLAQLDHRISHQRNGGKSMSFKDIDWLKPFITGPIGLATNEDAIDLIAKFNSMDVTHDIVYIDPPYGGNQSDYAAMYRFFNEYISIKRYEEDTSQFAEQSSRFVQTKGYDQQFCDLLEVTKKNPRLVFSYNDSSWCKIEDIVKAIKRFRSNVVVEEVDYSYGYRDQSNPAQEYIILAE